MADAGAVVVLAFAVCCLLVALPPASIPRLPTPPRPPTPPTPWSHHDELMALAGAAAVLAFAICYLLLAPAQAPRPADQQHAVCGCQSAGVRSALVGPGSSDEPQALDERTQPAVAEGENEGEDGILGWLRRLADHF